ncbi:DUF4383 domain-containing protein [Pseudonocardia alni]|uniref:DUF4383 domain-containing protein n=1 Tax=Pseudonocardia alni TaxID=33907 RepID=UPI00332F7D8A
MSRVWHEPAETSWSRRPGRLAVLHRTAAAVFGLVLCGFGVLGLVDRLDWFDTEGVPIGGLSTNGLLAGISLVVGGLLIAAAIVGERIASTALTVAGAAFMLSGIANVLVLPTSWNILAFGMSNVVFSLVSGAFLLILGAWGRFTGRLPPENPYRRERHPGEDRDGAEPEEQPGDGEAPDGTADRLPTAYHGAVEVSDVIGLAEAERAVSRGGATRAQADGVTEAGLTRRGEDRIAGWRRTRRGDDG